MGKGIRRNITVYGIVLVSVGAASLLRWCFGPALDYAPFVPFFAAVAISSWFGGLWPGLTATALSTLLGYYVFTGAPDVTATLVDEANVGLFGVAGVLVSVLMDLRLRAIGETQRTVAALQRLAVELTEAEGRQQRDMAQRLHDELQQLLVASKMRLALLGRGAEDGDIQSIAAETDELLGQAIQFTRTLTSELSPAVLYQKGLPAALQWLSAQMQGHYRLQVQVDAPPDTDVGKDELRLFVFRAVRELLINVAKYAQTDRAEVILRRCGERLRVAVADGGIGYDAAADEEAAAKGFGLFSIRERLEAMGGGMRTLSKPGGGTRVEFSLPCGPCAKATPGA